MVYRVIHTSLWTDPVVRKLTPEGRLLFIYLFSSPHSHVSGIYYLPVELMAKETGLKNTLCNTLLDTLSSLGLAWFDKKTEVIFVKNALRFQGKGLKNFQSSAKQLQELHKSQLINNFLQQYPEVKQHLSDTLLDTLSHTLFPQEQDQDQEKEQEQDQKQNQERVQGEEVSGALPHTPSVCQKPKCPHKEIINLYASILPELPQVRVWSDASRKNLEARWKEDQGRQSLEWWNLLFSKIKQSDFLMGRVNDAKFRASLTWIVKPSNLEKILNGNYVNHPKKGGSLQERNAAAAVEWMKGCGE